ncbi:hypothetical protein [Sulfobacillus thermosulfidooxidans]|uniref:hypothetical protein n=1 Tax=Sulfobacillus thermosulfidooxidans TaxID=28034 RepID=UPI0002ECC77B|nr:hypothetical protein [Sulfobacillus thermosulfidooxidans]
MFDQDVVIYGRHARYVKFLVNHKPVFKRYIDVYMVGSVIGLLENSYAEIDKDSTDEAKILAGQFARERTKCEFLYRLVMLMDEADRLTPEERLKRAFQDDARDPESLSKNMERFHGYVRGGIDYLHERFDHCTTEEDYRDEMHQLVKDFEQTSDGVDYDDIISNILRSK